MIPNQLSHYRVLEKIGSGGMGVVYRAHDEILDRDVALKVLPSGTLSEESARARFRREALALARLNHPNIGAVHEFGSEAGVDFLAMELVSGLTLDARLAAGPMEEQEVLRYGAQLADGLETAHQQGILHRDLKPANLRLSKDGRLKILDFGLAEWIHPEGDSDPTATNTKVSGTVAYMSPEQLRGKNADVRTDIYSAGAVLYEMATGKHPYAEKSGPQLIAQILDQPPARPTTRNRRISPILETIILKALDRDPERRYQSARELKIDLDRLSTGSAPVVVRRGPAWPWLAALVVVLVVAGLVTWSPFRKWIGVAPAASPQVRTRKCVAVLGFRNLSGQPDQAWLSTALGEMLSTELSTGGQLRSLSGENVVRMRQDLSLPDAESYAPDTLSRIRKHSGTDLVVLGSYMAMGKASGDQLRVDFHLQDTATGETLASVSETGSQPELLDLVSRTGSRLRGALGLQGGAGSETSTRASLPSGSEAVRLYAEGLAKLREFEALAARTSLERAVALDPKHALSHAALSDALAILGYDALARAEAQKAVDLSGGLSREEQFLVEGRLREVSRDWPRAIETYRTLWQFFPDNPQYGLRLATAQTTGGKGKDAIETLTQMRKMGGAPDPRIDLSESRAYGALGNFKPALDAAQRAIQGAQAQGARLIVAQAKLAEGFAYERLGEMEKAEVSFREGIALLRTAGDQRGAAAGEVLLGYVYYDQGNFAQAIPTFQESLRTFRQLGALRDSGRALNALGNVANDKGELDAAKDYYQQAEKLFRETADKAGLAGALGNLANVYSNMGDLQNARKMNEEGLALFREVGDQRGTASTLGNLGNTLLKMGELTEARQRYDEGTTIQKATGYRRGEAYAASNTADLLIATGDFSSARKFAEEALTIRKELGEITNVATSQQQLALIALATNRLDEAEGYLRSAMPVLQKANVEDDLISCEALLARVLLAKNKTAEADGLAAAAKKIAARPGPLPPRFEAALASARVDAAKGQYAGALQETRNVFQQAKRLGYVEYQLEARLVEVTILARAGRKPEAGAKTAELVRDARAGGFMGIAREAETEQK